MKIVSQTVSRYTALATGVIVLFICTGPFPAQAQRKQPLYTAEDPHGLKVVGMPKANQKYPITDPPPDAEISSQYSTCGKGVYYYKERVRGVDVTAVIVHFRAEGNFEFTDDRQGPLKPGTRLGVDYYVPPGWVALTFTLLPDSLTLQEIRVIRSFRLRPIPGTDLQKKEGVVLGILVRVVRSWVDKDPYVSWEILPESQLSHLIFRVRLPESTKACLQSKK